MDELRDWVAERLLEYLQANVDIQPLWEGLFAPALTGGPVVGEENTRFQFQLRSLSESEQDEMVESALEVLHKACRIDYSRHDRTPAFGNRYVITLGPLDAIVKATTPPTLLTLKLPDDST